MRRRRRVPVQLQMTQTECGAAVLAMVLSFYGRATTVAGLRTSLSAGRDGLTAQTIAEQARAEGMRVKAFSLEPERFAGVPLPAIVHWSFNHFVVVERWSTRRVHVVDPATGRRRLTAREFDEGFTGVVLTLEPGVHFETRVPVPRNAWRMYLSALVRTPGARPLLAQVVVASVVLQALGLALPALTAVVVDDIVPLRRTGLLSLLALGAAILVIAQFVTMALRSALLIHLQRRLDARLLPAFFEHLLALPFRFFAQRGSGDLLLRLGSNAMIRELLTSGALSAVLDGTLILAYLAVLGTRDVAFAGLALAVGTAQVALVLVTRRPVQRQAQRHLMAQASSQSFLHEALAGIATLKAAGAEDLVLDRWSDLFTDELDVGARRASLSAGVESARTALRVLAPLALLWLGAHRVLDGSLTLGEMFALTALALSLLTALASLTASAQQLQLVGAYLERLDDVLAAPSEQERSGARPRPRLAGGVELREVSFRYDPSGPWVLRNVSLRIEPGQKVAMVGTSGSGKSTLGSLLLGLYAPTTGDVLLDGTPIADLDLPWVRRQCGTVLQDTFLFNDSIRRNIAFTDPMLTLAEVREAATLAAIHDEIVRMPLGYETPVSEGGAGISGGQRQRIAIARALARRPAILLLDEATSNLDVASERRVDTNLGALGCTRVVIAHRLSTIRNADVIFVLDNGRLAEQGSHEELVAHGGIYAQLVLGQDVGGPAALAEPADAAR